jgi:hypothetical protein
MSEAPPQRLSADAKIGVLTAVLVAVTLAVQAVWLADGFTLAGHDVVRLAAVALLFAAAEKFVVTFPVRRGAHTISLSEIPLVLGLATIAPPTRRSTGFRPLPPVPFSTWSPGRGIRSDRPGGSPPSPRPSRPM